MRITVQTVYENDIYICMNGDSEMNFRQTESVDVTVLCRGCLNCCQHHSLSLHTSAELICKTYHFIIEGLFSLFYCTAERSSSMCNSECDTLTKVSKV